MSDPLVTSPLPSAEPPADRRFELRSRIGAGNHGVVFRAHDHRLGREVAIKRFSHVLADDPRAMRRITREVETLARVSHPHVVTVHDLVELPDGDGEITPHLVMELVEGISLRDLLATHGPSPRAVLVAKGVLEGLAACHAAGILHLDIKPANVLVTPTGGVKIVDFGISRAASDGTATIAGTPHYMAPEQFEGRADQRSDMYSVGCLLYECLTGRPPFEGTMAEQLLAHRHQPRPDPRALVPQVAPGLAAVVMRAMAVQPEHRYQNVDEMLTALAAAPVADTEVQPPMTAVAPSWTPEADQTGAAEEAPAGPQVTRWTRLGTFAAGLASSLVAVALIPAMVQATGVLVPDDYRPELMEGSTLVWWMAGVMIALLYLLLRRDEFFGRLGGPEVGEPRPDTMVGPWTWAGVRMAVSAGLRGSVLFLVPWYVLAVAGLAGAFDLSWPSDVFSSPWSFSWVLMPFAVVALLWSAMSRLRFRFGALAMSLLYLCGAGLAAVLFFGYPQVVGF